MGSEGGRNVQGILEAFLEKGVGLRSRQSLDIPYRDDGEGIPGNGSRRSKGPETAVHAWDVFGSHQGASAWAAWKVPSDGNGAGEVGWSARLGRLGLYMVNGCARA